MTYESETPAGSYVAGVSWKSLDCTSTSNSTSSAKRAQDLISKQVFFQGLEPMFTTLVIGGRCHEL